MLSKVQKIYPPRPLVHQSPENGLITPNFGQKNGGRSFLSLSTCPPKKGGRPPTCPPNLFFYELTFKKVIRHLDYHW